MLSQEHSSDDVIFNEKFHKVTHSKVGITNNILLTNNNINALSYRLVN